MRWTRCLWKLLLLPSRRPASAARSDALCLFALARETWTGHSRLVISESPEVSLIFNLLLGLAVLGTVTSTIFLFLVLAGALRFFREARAAGRHAARIQKFPPVSLLKPVHGLEAQLRENIESFFNQDYPDFEIIFGADTADDAALTVVREVSTRYP